MIKKKKIKKDPQRLKHSVRFDIEFFLDPKEKKVKKLLIVFVQKGGIADKKFLIGDVIKSVNGCLLYTSPSPRDGLLSRMPSSA